MIRTFLLPSLLTVLVFTACFFSAGTLANAAGYTVAPLVLNFDLEKREIVSQNITLTNNSSRMIRLYATVNNVATNGDGVVESFVQKVEADRTNTATTWVEISRQRIEIKPGEKKEVPFTIRMNPETAPGDYNVFVGFAEGSNRPQAEALVRQGQAPGTILHIAVDQEQNQFLRLEQFGVDKFVTGSDVEPLTFTLANPGRVDVVPAGEVIFYDNNGIEVQALPLNAQGQPVPAEGEAQYSMEVPDELRLGKYKAFLSVEYGDNLTASVHDTAFFYILPIKQVIIIFLVILVFAVLIALYVHRRYDVGDDDDGAESVAMYVREGKSADLHHDIDLTRKNETYN